MNEIQKLLYEWGTILAYYESKGKIKRITYPRPLYFKKAPDAD